jgi:hypothetical protein
MMINKNNNFQKLTPINNAELKIYEDALNFVFANDDIKNIAISGPYSAGKSSTIETYKSAHPNVRCLHISLAHFESTESGRDDSTEYSEAVLEGKILNQLIHQIDPDKIPRTNFKVKQKVSAGQIIINTVTITFLFVLVVYIGFFNNWSNFVSALTLEWLKNLLAWTTNSAFLLFSGLLCAVIFGIATYTIITTQKNKNIFRKVNLQGNEIEIFEENEDSYFDKYLNEVLYIFENSEADVIIFEDMDRYNVNQIFQKLREINILINNRRNKENKTPIRFFYLLRDDIFVSKDRTKFFDFIVPIVPIIDGSNSYDQFIEHFKKGGFFELFDEIFLQGLSLYIDDMRILKNIYNEFVIYHNHIRSIELNSNKLLAIIAYKNIFPRDFSDLQLGMGFVHTLFKSRDNFVKSEVQTIENQIITLENLIQPANDELLESTDELDAVYLKTGRYPLEVAGSAESNYKTRAQFIRAMKNNPNEVQYYNYNNGRRETFNIQGALNQLLQDKDYIERKQAIERKSGNQIGVLKAEIQTLQKDKSIIQNRRLREIITKNNIDTVFSVNFTNEIGEENKFEEIKASPYFPLVKYLVRNGYIDETYPDYMTYFYENSLSRIDKIFLRSVTDQVPKEYSYPLKNLQLVLSKLRVFDFDYIEILNFDLLCYLLKTKPSNNIYLTSFLQQLMVTKNYKFIGEFLGVRREIDLFVYTINNMWPSIFQCILTESGFSDTQKKQYAIDSLYYSLDADIEELNKNSCLSTFISGSPTLLDITTPNINKIIVGFSLIGVRFAWIDYDVSNKDLFSAVYKNNLYQLTFNVISLILKVVYGLTESSDFNSKNYTLVTSKLEEPLVQYVHENIDQYISIILDNCGECITDEERAALAILNNPDIDSDHKEEYINFLQTVIERIETVLDKELWSLLLQEKLVKNSENNILLYFFLSENGLDSFLTQFINNFNYSLKFDKNFIDSNFGEDSTWDFFDAMVACNELTNERYEAFLQALNMYYRSFSKTDIEEGKVLILIKLNIIQMTDSDLIFMREHYPDQLMPFIMHNIDQYTEDIINEENFVLSEMLSVLEENVDDGHKVKLLEFATDELSLKQKTYSDTVKLHILNYNLDLNDIPFLLNCYPKESVSVRAVIKSISIEHIADILNEQYSIPFELLSELFASNQLAREIKKELFALCLPDMNEAQVKEYLCTLQMNDFLSLFNRKRPKFEVNGVNKQILDIFKKERWIKTFEIDKDEPDYYRANGRKIQEDMAIELL